jgi:hypothetical protein
MEETVKKQRAQFKELILLAVAGLREIEEGLEAGRLTFETDLS